jgi:hypothetical protein
VAVLPRLRQILDSPDSDLELADAGLEIAPDLHQIFGNTCDVKSAQDHTIEQQEDEMFVIGKADAVGDPRAVVVHLEDAFGASGAVVSPVGFDEHARLAVADFAVRGARVHF